MAAGPGGPEINYFTFTSTNGGHTHSVTDHLHTLPANTGWMDRSNTHSHSVPVTAGTSGTVGEALAGKNLPPYFAVMYLVRAA